MRVQAGRESLCASLLAECSAEDLRATTVHKDSAFIYAANRGMTSLLEVFVEKGQDINVTDDEGSTALHSAVLNNEPDSSRAAATGHRHHDQNHFTCRPGGRASDDCAGAC